MGYAESAGYEAQSRGVQIASGVGNHSWAFATVREPNSYCSLTMHDVSVADVYIFTSMAPMFLPKVENKYVHSRLFV